MPVKPDERVRITIEADTKRAQQEALALKARMAQLNHETALSRAGSDKDKIAKVQLARELRNAQARAKGLAAEQRKLAKESESAAKRSAKLGESLKMVAKAGAAAGVAVGAAAAKLVKIGIEREGNIRGVEEQVQSLRAATADIIPGHALARLAEYQNRMNLSERQTNAIAKASVEFARINKIEFSAALEQVTSTAVNASLEGLIPLGIHMKESADKATTVRNVIARLTEKYGDMNVAVENAGEQQEALRNRLNAKVGALGSAITRTNEYRIAAESVAETLEWWAEQALRVAGTAKSWRKITDEVTRVRLGLFGLKKEFQERAFFAKYDRDFKVAMETSAKRIERLRELRAEQTKSTGKAVKKSLSDSQRELIAGFDRTEALYEKYAKAERDRKERIADTTREIVTQNEAINAQARHEQLMRRRSTEQELADFEQRRQLKRAELQAQFGFSETATRLALNAHSVMAQAAGASIGQAILTANSWEDGAKKVLGSIMAMVGQQLISEGVAGVASSAILATNPFTAGWAPGHLAASLAAIGIGAGMLAGARASGLAGGASGAGVGASAAGAGVSAPAFGQTQERDGAPPVSVEPQTKITIAFDSSRGRMTRRDRRRIEQRALEGREL